jgi:aryl-alcohol dehydrogenase-like predicted oxidoreductase
MQHQNLGSSGLRVSKVILGTMSYGSPTWQDWVRLYNTSRTPVARAV